MNGWMADDDVMTGIFKNNNLMFRQLLLRSVRRMHNIRMSSDKDVTLPLNSGVRDFARGLNRAF
jgi:hypothetical protein